jgi:hypothetical protein
MMVSPDVFPGHAGQASETFACAACSTRCVLEALRAQSYFTSRYGALIAPPPVYAPGNEPFAIVNVVGVGTLVTTQLPFTPVAPTTPKIEMGCPTVSPWLPAVVMVALCVFDAAAIVI